jgi:hypothetical protein
MCVSKKLKLQKFDEKFDLRHPLNTKLVLNASLITKDEAKKSQLLSGNGINYLKQYLKINA